MTERKTLYLLQYSRGIAALAVTAFHLSLLLGDPRYLGTPVLYWLTWRGNLGVDFFFVLSGFIIFYAHEQDIGRPHRLSAYLSKRFVRVYPVYWIYALGMCVLLALGLGSAAAFPTKLTDWISTLLLIRFDGFELPITPGWSLMHEIAFYAAFGLLIFNRWIGWAVLTLWLASALFVGTYAAEGARSAFTTYFSAFNLDFAIGILAYYIWKRDLRQLAVPMMIGGAILLSGWYMTELAGLYFAFHPLGYAVGFGLLIAGAATYESHRPVRPIFLFKFLGDASYSLYLMHLALLGLTCKIALAVAHRVPMPDLVVYAIAFICAVIGGCLAHLIVEKPVLAALRRRRNRIGGPEGRVALPTDGKGASLNGASSRP
jgi:exopolysaccharide production protein ExoZ